MLLASALFALFMVGFWLYCLTDAILTPAAECRGLPKPAWIAVITVTFIGGAIAWLILREPAYTVSALPAADPDDACSRAGRWTRADDAVARHPAGRARVTGLVRAAPRGPDDDPEFLRALDRRIRGSWQPGEEV
jgi:hypothetical protein